MNLYALSEHINLAIGILTLGGLLWGAWKWLWPALLRVTRYTIRVFDSLDQFLDIHVKPHPTNHSFLLFEDGERLAAAV